VKLTDVREKLTTLVIVGTRTDAHSAQVTSHGKILGLSRPRVQRCEQASRA